MIQRGNICYWGRGIEAEDISHLGWQLNEFPIRTGQRREKYEGRKRGKKNWSNMEQAFASLLVDLGFFLACKHPWDEACSVFIAESSDLVKLLSAEPAGDQAGDSATKGWMCLCPVCFTKTGWCSQKLSHWFSLPGAWDHVQIHDLLSETVQSFKNTVVSGVVFTVGLVYFSFWPNVLVGRKKSFVFVSNAPFLGILQKFSMNSSSILSWVWWEVPAGLKLSATRSNHYLGRALADSGKPETGSGTTQWNCITDISTGTGCTEKWWMPLPCRHPRSGWRGSEYLVKLWVPIRCRGVGPDSL